MSGTVWQKCRTEQEQKASKERMGDAKTISMQWWPLKWMSHDTEPSLLEACNGYEGELCWDRLRAALKEFSGLICILQCCLWSYAACHPLWKMLLMKADPDDEGNVHSFTVQSLMSSRKLAHVLAGNVTGPLFACLNSYFFKLLKLQYGVSSSRRILD